MKASTIILGLWLALLPGALLRSAEPVRKPTLAIALDDGALSTMLRSELSRDWLHANPSVVLTPGQKKELAALGHRMNAIRSQILAQFTVVSVEPEAVPESVRLHLPALRINHGRWESIDRRAFAFETRPLLTLDWYRTRYAALFDRDASLGALAAYGCSDEGYSGPPQVETPAPWELQVSLTKHE